MNENLKKIAKACGWKREWLHGGSTPNNDDTLDGDSLVWKTPKGGWLNDPPHFNSLDSMRAAVLMQDEEFQIRFNHVLVGITIKRQCYFHQLTVLDWQQAFVETLKQLTSPLPDDFRSKGISGTIRL